MNETRNTHLLSPHVDDDNDQVAYLREWAKQHPAGPRQDYRWLVLALTITCLIAAWATWQWALG
jgi:hypothetical protein